MSLINYQGNSKLLKRICQLLNVTDVQDGEGHSLVGSDGIAVVTGGGGGSSTLAGLSDVDTTGKSSGDVLAYNGTSQKWEDKTLASVATSGSYNDLSNKPTIPAAQVNSDWSASSGVAQILNKPTALSSFTNDQGFITSSVNNLTNYYLKSETYTKAEVNTLIGQISTISILVVQSLPTTDIQTNIIYLVPKSTAGTSNAYDEYINTDGTSAGWELIGDTEVDLSNYYTKSETDTLLNAKTNETSSFTEAQTRTNIASGDTITTILGKIKKYFTDLASVAFSGSYNDLSNQPTIPSVSANPSTTTATLSGIEIDGTAYAVQGGSANVQSDWNQTDTTADDYIKNKPTIPAAQVNSDWNASSGVAEILNKPSLATVATSGSYNDLSNTPTIPAAQVNSDWNSTSGVSQILNKPTLAAVATSGSYNDLSNKPSVTKSQFTPTYGSSTTFANRNFFVTDNETFLDVHFCLYCGTAINANVDLITLPTVARNKLVQYCVALETGNQKPHVIYNSGNYVYLDGVSTTANSNSVLAGMLRISLK